MLDNSGREIVHHTSLVFLIFVPAHSPNVWLRNLPSTAFSAVKRTLGLKCSYMYVDDCLGIVLSQLKLQKPRQEVTIVTEKKYVSVNKDTR